KESEKDFDNGLQQILATIRRAKGDKHIPFSVFKPTGMARFALLEKLNAKKSAQADPSSGGELTKSENDEFERVRQRFETICRTGVENNVPIFIDAEETWIQD